MTTKSTSILPRLFISIAITVSVVLVYANPVPENYQLDGFLQQQQQQWDQQELPIANEGNVVAYGGGGEGGDIFSAYGLQLGTSTSPTPTIEQSPTPAEGETVAWQWLDDLKGKIFGGEAPAPAQPQVTVYSDLQKAREEIFQHFQCGNQLSVCCAGNRRIPAVSGGKHVCENRQNYHPLPPNDNGQNLPQGKSPCIDPVYLQKCDDIEKYKDNDCFSDCKAQTGIGGWFGS